MGTDGVQNNRFVCAKDLHTRQTLFPRLLLNGSLTHGGLVWGPFRVRKLKNRLKHLLSNEWARAGTQAKICAGPGPGPGPGVLNRKGPHTKAPCVKLPFNNNRFREHSFVTLFEFSGQLGRA